MLSKLSPLHFGIYGWGSSTVTSSSSTKWSGAFWTVLIVILVLVVITVIANWRVFKKAGRPGWAAIIPVYSTWVLAEIAGKPGWWALIALIPYVGTLIFLVLYILICIENAKRFGQQPWFAILLFFAIGYWILGFGSAKYKVAEESKSDEPPYPTIPKE